MNKARFIERLNLYLDNELTDEEAAELLECARSNPEFQRLYSQYCQIFAACSQLKVDIGLKEGRPSARHKIYAAGGMAAAAALLFLAAQNLSPLIGDGNAFRSADTAAMAPASESTPSNRSFVVMDPVELETRRPNINDFQVATFDLDRAFETRDRLLFQGSSAPVKTRYAIGSEPTADFDSGWQNQFSFDQPVAASTFEHERLSSSEELERPVRASSPATRTRFEAAGAVSRLLRFDQRRADSVRSEEREVVVDATSGAAER